MQPKIVFKNEPKLSEHEVDAKFNERRINLVPYVQDFISSNERFKEKEISVTFADKGISSLISIIETSHEKLVLKIPLSVNYSWGEAQFLKVWEKAGIKVPHVFEEGELGRHPYTLMEYVDAPILGDVYTNEELIEKKIYLELGRILRIMHTPETEGYGLVVNGKAEYSKLSEQFQGPDMQKRFDYVKEHKLLGEEHGSLDVVLKMLLEHVEGKKSSYCHDDFGPYNMFATNPITVFDPQPRFSNGYLDLGRSLCVRIGHGISPGQLVEGYFGNEPYDKKVLHACIVLNIYMKLPYAHKTKKLKNIQNWQEYVIKNKHLLEK
ncbi:MAG TPA: aminoglycoside phosphotransferase family protein [Candidatus Paceibacterota bacterium]|jgi:fructosamine-3-kinase|nr:aminoglycoside phosphotransferase family protein [Candidatus Paceibacterota bacterium]